MVSDRGRAFEKSVPTIRSHCHVCEDGSRRIGHGRSAKNAVCTTVTCLADHRKPKDVAVKSLHEACASSIVSVRSPAGTNEAPSF